MKKNRKRKQEEINNKIIIGIVAIAVVVLIIVLCIFLLKNQKKEENIQKTSELEEKITTLASNFYETKYHSGLAEEKIPQLSTFQEIGIKFSLSDMVSILPMSEDVKELFESKKCNYDNSKVIIYPKDPYQAKDYEIKIELSCSE